jgi:ATP-binding protein involved in chromosome partitioning
MGKSNEALSYMKQKEADDRDARVRMSLKQIKKKFVVMSGKGGVGKTSVSVNLAIALAKRGLKVGLVDVDIHGPDVPRMLGIKDKIKGSQDQGLMPIACNEHLAVVSIESLIPDRDDAIIWRGPMKTTVIKQFIGDVAWGELDFLVIDSPPGTGDEPLTVAQTIFDAKAIIVTTPQEVSLADIRKSINFCKNVRLDIFGIIENMSSLTCPHCGQPIRLFGSGGGERTAQVSNNRFLGRIPFDLNMVTCADSGVSYQDQYPTSPVTKAFFDITAKMIRYD